MKIELSSKEQLRFVNRIENIFVDKIFEDNVLITDESSLLDFISFFDISRSIGISENGLHLFKILKCKSLKPREVEEEIIEIEADYSKQEYIEKIERVFGINVSEQFHYKLPDLFLYLLQNLDLNKKKELGIS